MDAPSLLVAVIMGLVVLAAVYNRMRWVAQEEGRRLNFDDEGKLVSIGDNISFEPLRFLGEGEHTTRVIDLPAGEYRVDYDFPDDVKVLVETIDSSSGEREMILLGAGAGAIAMTAQAGGRFMLHIAPTDEECAWELSLRRLGLPSGYRTDESEADVTAS